MRDRDKFDSITKHLLEDNEPSLYLNQIRKEKWFQTEYPFDRLYQLKNTPQSPQHHPEGDAWNHTMLVVNQAAQVKARSKNPMVFMWAALLHDIGKPETTKTRKGRITSYDHDLIGAKRSEEFLTYFHLEEEIKKDIVILVRYHMHMLYVLKNLPFGDKDRMKKEADLEELALLCYCDRMGRDNAVEDKEKDAYHTFLTLIS